MKASFLASLSPGTRSAFPSSLAVDTSPPSLGATLPATFVSSVVYPFSSSTFSWCAQRKTGTVLIWKFLLQMPLGQQEIMHFQNSHEAHSRLCPWLWLLHHEAHCTRFLSVLSFHFFSDAFLFKILTQQPIPFFLDFSACYWDTVSFPVKSSVYMFSIWLWMGL